jgi:hypothetical protein
MEHLVRIGTYNVLAQTLATSRYFPYSGSANLQARNRLPALSARLLGLRADVLGVTEAFPEALAALRGGGFDTSLYAAREGRPYGVAIAFREDRVELLGSAVCEFDDVADALAGLQAGGAPAAEAFRTNSVALFAALRLRGAPPGEGTFCVAATHFFWDPRLEPVKVAQAVALKRCAAEFSAAHAPPAGRAPLFCVGDFNSTPGSWACAVLQARGGVAAVGGGAAAAAALVRGWDARRGAGAAPRGAADAEAWRQRLRAALAAEVGLPLPAAPLPGAGAAAAGGRGTLRSAYACAGGENEITTLTATFAACIDFIFFLDEAEGGGGGGGGGEGGGGGGGGGAQNGEGCVVSVEPVPKKSQLAGPIPSKEEPSDHLPLLATFRV